MDSGNDVLRILNMSISMEREASVFYAGLTELFSHFPEVSGFWLRMHKEELDHMNTIESIMQSPPDGLKIDHARLSSIYKSIAFLKFSSKDSIAAVKTLEDAYKLAVNLEFSEINKAYGSIVEMFIRDDGRKAEAVENIKQHQEKLREFGHSFGDIEQMKVIRIKALT